MLAPVVEDVDKRVPYFARRLQKARMIPIGPHASAPMQSSIDGAGHADREAAHTTLEPGRRVRFHHQMQMISLNAELKNTEP
jgi:hypothetical protein